MQNKRSILGIDIDDITFEQLLSCTNEYLEDDILNIVYLAGIDTILLANEDVMFKEFIDNVDILVSGNEIIEKILKGFVPEISIAHNYLKTITELANNEQKKVLILLSNDKNIIDIDNYLKNNYPNIKYNFQILRNNSETELEIVMNEINVEIPDILVLLDEEELSGRWVSENKSKINAKLCICVGDIYNDIIKQVIEVPEILKKLHLQKFYKWLRSTSKIRRIFNKILFKIKLKF